jgi:hypothetical protein
VAKIHRTKADVEIEAEHNRRMAKLSGLDHWPPKSKAEWNVVLKRAEFSDLRREQFLGFEGVGELPWEYVSATSHEEPLFTPTLIAGLERWQAGRSRGRKAVAATKDRRKPGPAAKRDERADMVWKQWEEYRKLNAASAITVISGIRKGSVKRFHEWGKERRLANWPKSPHETKALQEKGRKQARKQA